MNRLIKGLLVVIGLLFSLNGMAHPGHGTSTGYDMMHYVTSPMHIGIVLGTVVILFAGYKYFRRSKSTSKK